MVILSDSSARERAATADDKNIVVTAGAGTGKTTLLVTRLLYLLLHRTAPMAIGDIVALTFTNKAADEMKLRLRTKLADLPENPLAATALRELEKSQIGTIHGFAAHLLRLYPIESGVDPAFRQDDGSQFDEFFQREWALWLDAELGPDGAQHDAWTVALRAVTLNDFRELAMSLAGESIPLDEAHLDLDGESARPLIRAWFLTLARAARDLRGCHPKTHTLERMLEESAAYLQQWGEGNGERASRPATLDREVPAITTQWSRAEYHDAKRIIQVARAIADLRIELLRPIVKLLVPFARGCRRRFVQTGLISFDGLIARARDLLRDYPTIRRDSKAQFRSILVDEFQDTDPVQYEMILYLAEEAGQEARDWRTVRLESGKLFIVGDPKQSIYAFRRADMEAYDAVIEDQVLAQAGERHTLRSNFRSHAGLLASINACFARIFPEQAIKGLQPRHDPLAATDHAPALSHERMELRVVRTEGAEEAEAEADAETVGRAEAEEMARWLHEEVLGKQEISEQGSPVKIKPGHVAILFRTLTDMRDYLEALRRHGIPCLTEGEKHFYERQEVIDAINALRSIVDSHDRLALVGVLRSALGALSDLDIEALARFNLLDYRITGLPNGLKDEARAAYDKATTVYALLRDLSRSLPRLPLTEAMDHLLATAPLLELAAASIDGEQAVANLWKLRDIVMQLATRLDLSLPGLVAELTKRALDPPVESERSLAEELNDDGRQGYVRLLSIHKSKGLEFPVVILAGLQRGTRRAPSPILVQHDWSSGMVGLKLGDLQTLGGIYVGARFAERQRAEQSRVLYVAMTRAKRRLVLSAGLPRQLAPDSFLSLLLDAFGLEPDMLKGEVCSSTISVEGATLHFEVVAGRATPLQISGTHGSAWREADDDIAALQVRWQGRLRKKEESLQTPLFLNPTVLMAHREELEPVAYRPRTTTGSDFSRLTGVLVHRALEAWDFARPPEQLPELIDSICGAEIPADLAVQAGVIVDQLHGMFRVFAASDPYAVLTRATIIGREVPFTTPWNDRQVMEGVIDLVYRLDGHLWIADYKTDGISPSEAKERAALYQKQAEIYRYALSRSTGESIAGFQFIFLRLGLAITV